jgi:peptidoglycan glycosyltransferase
MHLVIELTKYLMLLLMGAYTYHAFRVSLKRNKNIQGKSYRLMTWLLFLLHFTGYFTMYLQVQNNKLLMLYGGQVLVFVLVLSFYKIIYPGISGLLLRNMLMLLSIGFIILTRLSFDNAIRQFVISGLALGIGLAVPAFMQRCTKLRNYGWIYGIAGIALLVIVLLIGTEKYGATSWLTVFGLFTIQPIEFVKLLFVFCIASLFEQGTDFKRVCAVTAMAGAIVLALVFQKDLGGALIFFVTYVFMLYGATEKPLYLFAGLLGGSIAAWVAYRLFDHVKVRVMAWRNPFGYIDKEGYQISQSLFAIGTGGWFGMGLYQGLPTTIPVVDSDFIYSAISEEFGGLFALCLILIYINCFIILINVSLKTKDKFYSLLSLGFSVMFGFQMFLSIGGVIKFIPSTGVTLPFVSSGGSSILATIIMFMVIQGIYHTSNASKSREVESSSVGETHEE